MHSSSCLCVQLKCVCSDQCQIPAPEWPAPSQVWLAPVILNAVCDLQFRSVYIVFTSTLTKTQFISNHIKSELIWFTYNIYYRIQMFMEIHVSYFRRNSPLLEWILDQVQQNIVYLKAPDVDGHQLFSREVPRCRWIRMNHL